MTQSAGLMSEEEVFESLKAFRGYISLAVRQQIMEVVLTAMKKKRGDK